MIPAFRLAARLKRHKRMETYKNMRCVVENLPESDLADLGIKRAQLGTLARKLALR